MYGEGHLHFSGLARALPHVSFTALPGWGTTSDDLRTLASAPERHHHACMRRHIRIVRRTSVLLMPSLWFEGFGLIVMEAMLRGIPVIASDSGGLKEAKQGTAYVIPVQPIRAYEQAWDERHMPRAVLPEQDLTPWMEAMRKLTSDRAAWREESRPFARAALKFVASIDAGALERFLLDLRPVTGDPLPAAARADAGETGTAFETPARSGKGLLSRCEYCWRTIRCSSRRMAAEINRTAC